MARPNGHPTSQAAVKGDKAQSHGEDDENIWSSLLDSVASGKRLPEKTLIVLGMMAL
jgi:dynein light intermediate chain 1, cytosolic